MNINTGVMSLNLNNVLIKKHMDKEHKEDFSTLKINDNTGSNVVETDINVTNENLVASESDIKNTEMAEELLKNTKDNILQRSTMAILSQANKNSSDVIALLQ